MRALKILCLLAALACLTTPAALLAQVSVTGDVSATIQNQAITLTEDASLSFGTILPFGRPGTVALNTNGSANVSNAYQTAPGSAASWSVTGVPNAYFSITLPANGTITVTSGAFSMDVDNFNHSLGSAPRLDAAGQASFNVGALLRVGANQPSGSYTGTYDVTVAYN